MQNILLNMLLGLAAFIALLLVLGLFMKKDYSVMRSIVINRPNQVVFDYIKLLRNQDNYSKWASMDPNMKKDFRGTDGTVGAVSAWEGNKKVGQGEQEIMKIEEGKRIEYDLRFIKPFRSQADVYLTTQPTGDNQTEVTWGFSSRMNYPFNILLKVMNMEKMLGNDFSTGLNNLKTILEK